MLVVGMDENGLGPKLGPLVTTACGIEVQNYDAQRWREKSFALGIDDSKKTSAFGHMAWAESVALALIERVHHVVPQTADQLFDLLNLASATSLKALCPNAKNQAQCWSDEVLLPGFEGSLDQGRKVIEELENMKCVFRYLQTNISCPQKINAFFAKGIHKFLLDLRMFEELFEHCHQICMEPVWGICGMVGGIRKYRSYFSIFSSDSILSQMEKKGNSTYEIQMLPAGKSSLSFQTSADALHFPVSMASMIGKYVRELWMRKLASFYSSKGVSESNVSGYHDLRTKAFIERSALLRRKLQILDTCFMRSR